MLLGCAPSWVILEWNHRAGRACDWLPEGLLRRLAFYCLTFVVGLFVIYPGIALDSSISMVYRVVAAGSLISLVALLLIHLGGHRAEHEEELPSSRGLRFLSMLPIIALGLMVATILFVGVVEVIIHPPR
jgi:hypothetical protein